ncbi:MAG: thermonuclease family protein [candidate division Zixibacteria bacterium]|nr:thermonuclease family protein [candidate division Zixibacteria bacterium]
MITSRTKTDNKSNLISVRPSHLKAFLILFISISLLVPSCGKEKSKDEKTISTKIAVTVYDGDTFTLSSGKKVRIAMIDTPEKGEPFCDEATQYLSDLVLGKEVSLKPIGKGIDRYGRTLAEVYVDSANVSQLMLKAGLAVLYLFKDNAYLKDEYLQYQIYAYENKIGIWSLPEPVAEEYYINIKGSYRFHRPLCFHLKKVDISKIRRIATRAEAIKQGLSPCRNCRP